MSEPKQVVLPAWMTAEQVAAFAAANPDVEFVQAEPQPDVAPPWRIHERE